MLGLTAFTVMFFNLNSSVIAYVYHVAPNLGATQAANPTIAFTEPVALIFPI